MAHKIEWQTPARVYPEYLEKNENTFCFRDTKIYHIYVHWYAFESHIPQINGANEREKERAKENARNLFAIKRKLHFNLVQSNVVLLYVIDTNVDAAKPMTTDTKRILNLYNLFSSLSLPLTHAPYVFLCNNIAVLCLCLK